MSGPGALWSEPTRLPGPPTWPQPSEWGQPWRGEAGDRVGRAAWERASPQEGPFLPGFLGLGQGTERARRCPCWPRHCGDVRQEQGGRAGAVSVEVRPRHGPQPGLEAEGEKGEVLW